MKKSRMHVLSYLAALVIGAILFAIFWRWMFGSGSSAVVIAGIAGVVIAVIIFLLGNEFKKPGGDRSTKVVIADARYCLSPVTRN